MAQLVSLIMYLGIFLFSLGGLGSAVRIVTDPEPYSDLSEKINITCVPDGPTYTSKSIMSMQIMKQNEPTMAFIDLTQKLGLGAGSHDNMKAEGHIDRADASKSRLTLIIEKPGRQDTGVYRCRVFFADESFNLVEDDVFGNVTHQDYVGCMNEKIKIDYLTKENNQQKTKNDYLTKENNQHKTRIERLNKDATQKQMMKDDNQRQIRQLELQVKNLERKSCPITTTPATTTTKLPACPGRPDGWVYYKKDKTCLKFFNKWVTWPVARRSCQANGADLVIIRDQDKNNFVFKMVHEYNSGPWLGLRNQARRGYNFKHVDGSALGSYHPWIPGYPEGGILDDKKCVYMYSYNHGGWFDEYCGGSHPYMCST